MGLAKWLGYLEPASPHQLQDLPPWVSIPSVVDYSKVPAQIQSQTLRVAQWYQYWPPSFLDSFVAYIQQKYGVTISVIQEVYTGNEELFNWITQAGKRFDVMFPTDYMIEAMDRSGLLLNLNPDWLPNFTNLFPQFRYADANPYEYRGLAGALRAVPYQWGTTGIGFRTDLGWTRADVEADGYDIFWMDSYKGVDLNQKKMMLDDARQTIGATFKYLGWKAQRDLRWTPTNITRNPAPPYEGEYQWSLNERDATKLAAAEEALLSVKPSLYDFNTQNQGPYLAQDVVRVDSAWSGDIMYAIRPNTASPQPIDYAFPIQGFPRWMDAAVVHKESHNLFLAHEFIDYFLDPQQGASISDWNLYATPNEASFALLKSYPTFGWDPREDPRIYADLAVGYSGPSILERAEYLRDLGVDWTGRYLTAWNEIKYG